MSYDFAIFSGTANPALAEAIAQEMGEHTGACTVERFPDGEVSVRLLEPVRRKEVFLVQPTSPPVNDHLMELLALADACRRAAAARITAVVSYFGYSRADKRLGRREPITGRVVADLMEAVGIGHVVTVDLHTPQIEGFFRAVRRVSRPAGRHPAQTAEEWRGNRGDPYGGRRGDSRLPHRG